MQESVKQTNAKWAQPAWPEPAPAQNWTRVQPSLKSSSRKVSAKQHYLGVARYVAGQSTTLPIRYPAAFTARRVTLLVIFALGIAFLFSLGKNHSFENKEKSVISDEEEISPHDISLQFISHFFGKVFHIFSIVRKFTITLFAEDRRTVANLFSDRFHANFSSLSYRAHVIAYFLQSLTFSIYRCFDIFFESVIPRTYFIVENIHQVLSERRIYFQYVKDICRYVILTAENIPIFLYGERFSIGSIKIFLPIFILTLFALKKSKIFTILRLNFKRRSQ